MFFNFDWFFKMNHFTVSHIFPKLLCLWIRIWNYKCFQSSLFSFSPVKIFFICYAYFDFSCWCKLLIYYLRKKLFFIKNNFRLLLVNNILTSLCDYKKTFWDLQLLPRNRKQFKTLIREFHIKLHDILLK